ncbi:non-SERCA-type Ca2+ -transporting P-ATPase, partial [Hepatocystis sp. ex Piliocolobus tephrosceles]
CPAVALSREPANDDNMKIPPRKKKKPIMTKRWWVYGIIPHTIFEALCVLLSLALSLYICTGKYNLDSINGLCKTININSSVDSATMFEYKYFCSSHEYRFSHDYVGWVTNISFWDPQKNKTVTFWGAAKGKIENINTNNEQLHERVKDIMKTSCTDAFEVDDSGWCKPKAGIKVKDADEIVQGTIPRSYEDVTALGSKRGRTMAFITAVWCEMLRAYTVRSWEPFYKVFNRNMWMHLACSISATLTFFATSIPGITDVLNTTCLYWWQY